MTAVAHLHEVSVEGDAWPLLPVGEYTARLTGHATVIAYRTPRVYLYFTVADPGEHFGSKLFAAYRVRRLGGKDRRPRKDGSFVLARGSNLYRELCNLTPDNPRPDRISLRGLRKALLRVRVRTVTRDHRPRPLARALQYSIVDEILGIEVGDANA